MKNRVLILTILFIIFFGIYNFAYADYGIPDIIEYKAIITNKEGAVAKGTNKTDEDITIPYNEQVVVYCEADGDKVPTVFVRYESHTFKISMDDIKPIEDSDSLVKKAQERQVHDPMYVFREGAYLYEGPSICYDQIFDDNGDPIEIPVGTTVEFEASADAWGYTEYNGTKGWVYICTSPKQSVYRDLDCALAFIAKENYSDLYTLNKITLYNEPGGNKVTGTIPADEIVTYLYSVAYPDPHCAAVYIETKNAKGWYQVTDVDTMQDYSKFNVDALITSNTSLYKNINLETEKASNEITKIPEGEKVKLLAVYKNGYTDALFAYIEYDGQKGFYMNTGEEDECIMLPKVASYFDFIICLKEDAEIFDIPNYESTGEYFNKGEKLSIIYESYPYMYVTNGNKEGIIYLGTLSYDIEEETELVKDTVSKELTSNVVEDNVVNDSETEEIEPETNEIETLSRNNLAICIYIAIIVLAIIVIKVKIGNKKDTNNTNNTNNTNQNNQG